MSRRRSGARGSSGRASPQPTPTRSAPGLPADARLGHPGCARRARLRPTTRAAAAACSAEAVTAGLFHHQGHRRREGPALLRTGGCAGRRRWSSSAPMSRRRIFPNIDPIDRIIKLEGYEFRVVGVMEKQGTSLGFNFDNQIFGPFHSVMNRVTLSHRDIAGIVVQAPYEQSMPELQTHRARDHAPAAASAPGRGRTISCSRPRSRPSRRGTRSNKCS